MLELLKLNNAKFKEGSRQDQLYDHQNLVKMIMESALFKDYEELQDDNSRASSQPSLVLRSTGPVSCSEAACPRNWPWGRTGVHKMGTAGPREIRGAWKEDDISARV